MSFFNWKSPLSKSENKTTIAPHENTLDKPRNIRCNYQTNDANAPTPIRKNSKRNLLSDADTGIQATQSSNSATSKATHTSNSAGGSNDFYNFREKGNARLPSQIKDLNNEVALMMLDTLQHKKSSSQKNGRLSPSLSSTSSASSAHKFWKKSSKSTDSSKRSEPFLLTADDFETNQDNKESKDDTNFWKKKSMPQKYQDPKKATLLAENGKRAKTVRSHMNTHNNDDGSRQASELGALSLDYTNMSYFTDEEKIIIQQLAKRKYHLPGNSYWQDYCEYLVNNHQIFCFCFRHPLHPLRMTDRIFILVGSLGFGVFITNAVVILYATYNLDFNQEVLSIFGGNDKNGLTVTKGMISMWISGGIVHSLFDCLVWYITACPCVQAGGCITNKSKKIAHCFRFLGRNLASVIVIACISVATVAIVVRVDMTAKKHEQQQQQQQLNFEAQTSLLILYLVELGFSLFVFNPLVKFIMFSGIIGCCRIPIIGGRPYEMRKEEKAQEEKKYEQNCHRSHIQHKDSRSQKRDYKNGLTDYQIA